MGAVQTYRLQANGDEYWKAFQLCRIRLAYVFRLRHLFPEPWSQQDFECFFLHSRLLIEQLLEIINDAKSVGLSAKMPSFRKKLSEEEKMEIISWLKTLK